MSGGAPAKSIAAARERLRWIEETLDRGGCDFIPKGGYREPFIVCDECSMVSEKLRDDILSRGDKVLFVGDPGQLPPVKGRGFFEVNRPNAMLEEVHRQARGSRILQLATAVRLGERFSAWGGDCERVAGFPGLEALDGADQVITGTNKTRLEFNLRARRRGGFERGPKAGEPLICLRNDHALRFMNGLQATTLSDAVEQPLSYTLDIEYDGQLQRQLTVDSFHFDRYSRPRMTRRDAPWDGLPEFDFGYCVTVHKAQGSEWPWVVVLDDDMRGGSRDFRQRWIYTAATRASERLTWVRPRQ